MASELYVETLKGLTSGANANKVIIPSGQTLDASAGGFTTPAGHVIQVVSARSTAQTGTSSSSYVDAGISASITPSSTSSSILVIVTGSVQTGGGGGESQFQITDGSNTALTNTYKLRDVDGQMWGVLAINYMDSPSSTSALTYKLRMKTTAGTVYFGTGGDKETMTLMEIAG